MTSEDDNLTPQDPIKGPQMNVEQFLRKTFPVDAVRVSASNMEEVAKWCDGTIHEDDGEENPTSHPYYIKVRVQNPLTERQTRAYDGDWVLYAGKGYKVYTDRAFRKSFDEKPANVFYNPPVTITGGGGGIGGGNPTPPNVAGGSGGGGQSGANPGGTTHIS